ncbi:MAG: hypothetical protein WD738_11120 [Pirellulales bacterium]
MNIQDFGVDPLRDVHSPNGVIHEHVCWDGYSASAAAVLMAARDRLAAVSWQSQRRKKLSNEVYYGEKGQLEETIPDLASTSSTAAIVTRNHYGCLVLNAAHALFIDVDLPEPSHIVRRNRGPRGRQSEPWRRTLDDLRTVLASKPHYGFRIYRTAAGFRILATTHEFEPESLHTKRLMDTVGADADFIHLCQMQRNFRARLTPKPWRCGARRPPNSFPRECAEERSRFTEWLTQYECAARNRATCRFLEQTGPTNIHERIAPIVELHDRETKAFQCLPLA